MSTFGKYLGLSGNGKGKDIDPCQEEIELPIEEIIEIVVKDNQQRLKDISVSLAKIEDNIPTIKELKEEIKELKAELRAQIKFNQDLIIKFVDKPTPPSAAAQYLANKAAEASSKSSTAGPASKLP